MRLFALRKVRLIPKATFASQIELEVLKMWRRLRFLLLLSTAVIPVLGQSTSSSPQSNQDIGYKSAAGADQKKTLLLKDFHPVSMLHAPQNNVDRAKYYVIDVHNHVNDAQGIDDPAPESHRRYA